MNINTPAGHKIICINPEHGLACSSVPLMKGGIYTVRAIDAHSFLTFIFLEEVPEENFNSVMFISCPFQNIPLLGNLLIRLLSFLVKLF